MSPKLWVLLSNQFPNPRENVPTMAGRGLQTKVVEFPNEKAPNASRVRKKPNNKPAVPRDRSDSTSVSVDTMKDLSSGSYTAPSVGELKRREAIKKVQSPMRKPTYVRTSQSSIDNRTPPSAVRRSSEDVSSKVSSNSSRSMATSNGSLAIKSSGSRTSRRSTSLDDATTSRSSRESNGSAARIVRTQGRQADSFRDSSLQGTRPVEKPKQQPKRPLAKSRSPPLTKPARGGSASSSSPQSDAPSSPLATIISQSDSTLSPPEVPEQGSPSVIEPQPPQPPPTDSPSTPPEHPLCLACYDPISPPAASVRRASGSVYVLNPLDTHASERGGFGDGDIDAPLIGPPSADAPSGLSCGHPLHKGCVDELWGTFGLAYPCPHPQCVEARPRAPSAADLRARDAQLLLHPSNNELSHHRTPFQGLQGHVSMLSPPGMALRRKGSRDSLGGGSERGGSGGASSRNLSRQNSFSRAVLGITFGAASLLPVKRSSLDNSVPGTARGGATEAIVPSTVALPRGLEERYEAAVRRYVAKERRATRNKRPWTSLARSERLELDEVFRVWRNAAHAGLAAAAHALGVVSLRGHYSTGTSLDRSSSSTSSSSSPSSFDNKDTLRHSSLNKSSSLSAVDAAKAAAWHRCAAEQGDVRGMFAIACCARDGIGMEPSAATSYRWFSAAAHLGLPAAQYSLGRCFEMGFGCTADALKAVKWYELAAGGGDAQAMGALGNLHAVGAGELNTDKDAAARWWARAAAKGLAPAQFNLARAFEHGYKPTEASGLAVKPHDDTPEASLLRSIQLYEAAAEQGLTEARVKLKELVPESQKVGMDLGQDSHGPGDIAL